MDLLRWRVYEKFRILSAFWWRFLYKCEYHWVWSPWMIPPHVNPNKLEFMQHDLPAKTLILQTIVAQPKQWIGLGEHNTFFQVLINLKFLTPPLILITQGEICQMRTGVEKTFSELSKRVSPAEDFYNRWEECGIQCQLSKRLTGPIIPLSWSCLVCKRVSHQ